MGKMALIMTVATATVVFGSLLFEMERGALQTKQMQAATQEMILARQIARSGLDAAASQIVRNFDNWRSGYDSTGYQGGHFDVSVDGSSAGPVVVVAEGYYDATGHRKRNTLVRLSTTPSALLVDADSTEVTLLGKDWLISGEDTRPPGSIGSAYISEGNGGGQAVHAVYMSDAQGSTAFTDALTLEEGRTSLIRGAQADTDITEGTLGLDLTALYNEAVPLADQSYAGNKSFSGTNTFGSATSPVIVHIEGDATFRGTTNGYGLLLVEGNLDVDDDFSWEGIVYVRGSGELAIRQAGNARIYGALATVHYEPVTNNMYHVPEMTVWAVDDSPGKLHYFVLTDTDEFYNLEGDIQGVGETKDIEAFTVNDDGYIYFVNNYYSSKLFRIPPGQIDEDPDTPVMAELVGNTGLNGKDAITSLHFIDGALFGLSHETQKLYTISTGDGTTTVAASVVSTIELDVNGSFRIEALTQAPDGTVYFVKAKSTNSELWKFDSFPSEAVSKVMKIDGSGDVEALSAHLNGYLYAADDNQWYRIDPTAGTTTVIGTFSGDVEGMDFYLPAENEGSLDSGPHADSKTTICHIPPGNPDNAHTITVGNSAVNAHVNNHGDTIGACNAVDDAEVVNHDDATYAVRPVLECKVTRDGYYEAYFGYLNENTYPVRADIGTKNKFTPTPQDQGQPTDFLEGRQRHVFSITYTSGNHVWTLGSRTSTASPSTTECSTDPGENQEEKDEEGVFRYSMQENAALYYSTEAIGKLAARLTSVRDRAWVVRFDYWEEDL